MATLTLRMTVLSVVVNAVGTKQLLKYIKTPIESVEAVMMVNRLWNIAEGVCI